MTGILYEPDATIVVRATEARALPPPPNTSVVSGAVVGAGPQMGDNQMVSAKNCGSEGQNPGQLGGWQQLGQMMG